MEETVLREQLRTVDESLLFLLLIVLSVLLSYWGVRIQREGLCRTLQGDAEGAAALPRVLPSRLSATALVVGGRVVSCGRVPGQAELREMLQEALEKETLEQGPAV